MRDEGLKRTSKRFDPSGAHQITYDLLQSLRCSRGVEVAIIKLVICARYFLRLLLPTRQQRVTERYSRPKITKYVTGPRVLLLINLALIAYIYTVFRVRRITPHPDIRNLRKQAKKNLRPFSISPGSPIAGSQESYIQPILNMRFFL